MVLSGTSFPTTAPAATMAFSPMVTPANIVALAPIQAFFLMMMGTRAGDIDGGAVTFIEKKLGLDADGMSNLLNKKIQVIN